MVTFLYNQFDGKLNKLRFRLAAATIEISHAEPLPDRIPMHVLLARKKDPSVDKLNVIEERLAIQRRMLEKRKKITSVIPQVNTVVFLEIFFFALLRGWQVIFPGLRVFTTLKPPNCLGQMLTVKNFNQHLVSLSKIIRLKTKIGEKKDI